MIAIVLWLCGIVLSFVVLYMVVRAAINDSNLSSIGEELRASHRQLQRQHEELMRQLEEVKLAIREKDAGEKPTTH